MRYYGQFGIDKFIHETFFPNKENGFFIECGAFDGVMESTCYFFEQFKGWKGINIEAVPHLYNLLCNNRPDAINLNYALSDNNTILQFEHVIHPQMGKTFGNGSLNLNEEHKQNLIKNGCTIETINVECIKFSDIVQQQKIKNIDLFVLDVEGHEDKVLLDIINNVEYDVLPQIFCIEFGWVTFDKIVEILGDKYEFNCMFQNNAFFIKK